MRWHDGSLAKNDKVALLAGDKMMILMPKIERENIEVACVPTQVLFQIVVVATTALVL